MPGPDGNGPPARHVVDLDEGMREAPADAEASAWQEQLSLLRKIKERREAEGEEDAPEDETPEERYARFAKSRTRQPPKDGPSLPTAAATPVTPIDSAVAVQPAVLPASATFGYPPLPPPILNMPPLPSAWMVDDGVDPLKKQLPPVPDRPATGSALLKDLAASSSSDILLPTIGAFDAPPPVARKRSREATPEQDAALIEPSAKKTKKEGSVADTIRLRARTMHKQVILQEWETLVCPELWDMHLNNASKSRHDALTREVLARGRQTIASDQLFTATYTADMAAQDAAARQAWCDKIEHLPELAWVCDTATLKNIGGTSLTAKNAVYVAGRRHAEVMSRCLWDIKADRRGRIVVAYDKGTVDILSLSNQLNLPPFVVLRIIIGNKRGEESLSRALWHTPHLHLSTQLCAEVNVAKAVDTGACQDRRWALLEKVSMIEKLFKAWCKAQNIACLPRDVDPSAAYPKPSLLTSPFEIEGRMYHWIEVCTLYGLRASNVADVVRGRAAALAKAHGSGLFVLTHGADEGFAAEWDPATAERVHVVTPSTLHASFETAIVDILANDLLYARCLFDRLCPTFFVDPAKRSPRKSQALPQSNSPPDLKLAPDTPTQTEGAEPHKPQGTQDAKDKAVASPGDAAVPAPKKAAGRGSRGSRGTRSQTRAIVNW